MKRRLVIVGVSAAVLAMAGAGTVYFGFIRTDAAAPLRLPPVTASPQSPLRLPGGWQVASESEAGYRIQEEFLRDRVQVEAVGRTSAVSGSLLLVELPQGGGYEAHDITVTVDLTKLRSDEPSRDDKVFSEFLEPDNAEAPKHPTSTFEAQQVVVPASARDGKPFAVTASGRLTIRGVTQPVSVTLECQLVADTIRIAGSMPFTFEQFGITQLGPGFFDFVAVEPKGTIEFLLNFTKSS